MESDLKIVAGLGSLDDYELLAKAGADELFCGFVPNSWNRKYGNMLPLNRREVFFYHVNIGTYEDMKILKKKMELFKIPVTVALNALYYNQEQIEDIVRIVERLCETGFSSYIVADWNLAMELRRRHLPCKIHLSGEVGEWNTKSISFFAQHLQVERIIFHRKNLISDMKSCIEQSEKTGFAKEYEAFFINELCHYTGGFCNSLHCDEMVHACQLPYKMKPYHAELDHRIAQNDSEETEYFDDSAEEIVGHSGCGLCALWDLYEAGIRYLKIVGRGKSGIQLAGDIRATVSARNYLFQAKTGEDYRNIIKQTIFTGNCSNNCYYR